MAEFSLHYTIDSSYDNPVFKGTFQLLVLPCVNAEQRNVDMKFICSGNANAHLSKNIFGFETINYFFNVPFTTFHFEYKGMVKKKDTNPFNFISLSKIEENKILNDFDFYIANHLFLKSTDLTHFPAQVEADFPVYDASKQVFDFLLALNTHIFKRFDYVPQSTNVGSTVADVLQLGKGVCQDFAHLFISVCRKNKIPARYVSGYLNQGVGYVGASQLHAWCEALIPGIGWIGFDPTNNLLPDENYIKIAHGLDYSDCSPIKGVLENSGMQKSTHSVMVMNQ